MKAIVDKNGKHLNVMMISADYEIERLQKLLFSNGLTSQSYILKNEHYGNKLDKKLDLLKEELCSECIRDLGYPQSYFFNAEGEVLYHHGGTIPADTLEAIGIQL